MLHHICRCCLLCDDRHAHAPNLSFWPLFLSPSPLLVLLVDTFSSMSGRMSARSNASTRVAARQTKDSPGTAVVAEPRTIRTTPCPYMGTAPLRKTPTPLLQRRSRPVLLRRRDVPRLMTLLQRRPLVPLPTPTLGRSWPVLPLPRPMVMAPLQRSRVPAPLQRISLDLILVLPEDANPTTSRCRLRGRLPIRIHLLE